MTDWRSLCQIPFWKESDQTKETDKGAIDKPDKEEPPKKEDDGLKIDPVMQKYMEMAQKRRLEESKKQEEEQVEREVRQSDEVVDETNRVTVHKKCKG